MSLQAGQGLGRRRSTAIGEPCGRASVAVSVDRPETGEHSEGSIISGKPVLDAAWPGSWRTFCAQFEDVNVLIAISAYLDGWTGMMDRT